MLGGSLTGHTIQLGEELCQLVAIATHIEVVGR